MIEGGHDTTVYTIRYLKAIDEATAAAAGECVFWMASNGDVHLPFGCTKHFGQMRNQERRLLTLVQSSSLSGLNLAKCCRDMLVRVPDPLVCVGRMIRECVEIQVAFLLAKGDLPPAFEYDVGLNLLCGRIVEDESEFRLWVQKENEEIAARQAQVLVKTQEFYSSRRVVLPA